MDQLSNCCSADQANPKKQPTCFSGWRMSANAKRWWLAGSRSRGFTSYSVRTYQRNSFERERDSAYGSWSDAALTCTHFRRATVGKKSAFLQCFYIVG